MHNEILALLFYLLYYPTIILFFV